MISEEQSKILHSISIISSDNSNIIDTNADWNWEALLNMCERQEIVLFCSGLYQTCDVPKVKTRWRRIILNQQLYYEYVLKIIHEIQDAFFNADVNNLLIKGIAIEKYYPAFMMRAMGDVDFLVNRNDLQRCRSILIEKGFDPIDVFPENQKHLGFL